MINWIPAPAGMTGRLDATWANYPYYDTSWFDSVGRTYFLSVTWKAGGAPLE